MKYKWIVKESQEVKEDFLDLAFNSRIVAQLLLNRGINLVSKARFYLDPNFYEESNPQEIPDLLKARDRILQAISKNEKITIYGDYDVDGVTATSCLLTTLKQFTENIDFYIPSRITEGYGLNKEAVKLLKKENKTDLLITCDCGITNHKEIELANSLGMDVIVTDHHSLPENLPPACAVLNPRLLPPDHKLHNLPGVGVAYKLAQAILKTLSTQHLALSTKLLDLVTLGMIADLAPLVDENRYLVQIGLPKLASTNRIGLKELLRICGYEKALNTDSVGFGIAPRINAIGRLADAKLAVKLLTTNDLLEAVHIATELDIQNKHRQLLCEKILDQAVTLVSEYVDLKNDKCIVLAKEDWHHGVLGIVASRIVEKFNLPTILIGVEKEQNIGRGSGRSINALNITDVLCLCSNHLERFGGHKAACGLSIRRENIEGFVLEFKAQANKLLKEKDLEPTLQIDMELPITCLNRDLLQKINKLSPFGLGNPTPLFASEEVEVVDHKTIGKDGKHLKLMLKSNIYQSSKVFESLIWNNSAENQFKAGDVIKVAYAPKLNSYNGEVFTQLEIKDWQFIRERIGVSAYQRDSEREVVELYDYRGRTQECINSLTSTQVLFFAETLQKDFLPLKTSSRSNLCKTESLVFLEIPPDENTLLDIINRTSASKVYFAFTQHSVPSTQYLLKRLIGMLKYVKNNKNSIVSETELQSALGLNKTTLSYALELLNKIDFLSYKKENGFLNINIFKPSRQDLSGLIEYNMLLLELKQISNFTNHLKISSLKEIKNKLVKLDSSRVYSIVEKIKA